MASYVDVFGIERVYGLGEGVDFRNGTSAEGMSGSLHEIVCPLSLTGPSFNRDGNNDGVYDSFGRGVANVPAGAAIDSCDVKIEEAEGLTGLTIGLFEKDGTAIDADGLYKTADGLTPGVHAGSADLNGALLEDAGFIKAEIEGATALKGFVIVRYIM